MLIPRPTPTTPTRIFLRLFSVRLLKTINQQIERPVLTMKRGIELNEVNSDGGRSNFQNQTLDFEYAFDSTYQNQRFCMKRIVADLPITSTPSNQESRRISWL